MSQLARVTVEDRADLRIASFAGEIDASNAAEVRDAAIEGLGNAALGIAVDLSELTYLDSAGVGVLFEVAERFARRGVAVALAVPPGAAIRRTLEITELGSIVPLEATIDEAISRIRAEGGSQGGGPRK